MRIAVCVITYKRPDGLKRLLDGLNQLTFKKCETPALEIIVVDNDADGSAYTLCESIKMNLKWSLKCYVESRRGIPFARNKAVACAGDVDFIAFIDDDEVPEPNWLDELLHTQKSYNSDVVSGPVLPYFKESVPAWMIEGGFFERLRYPTGYPLEFAATNNVLIRSDVFQKMDKIFDEDLALTGGSDKEFFVRVYRAGYKIVWADEALVYEWVPKSRANVKWILQRSYRLGNTDGLCELDFNPSISARIIRITKSSGRIVLGVLFIPLSLALGQLVFINNLRSICRGAGILAAIVGSRYEEYRTVHQV